jgi:hypothetical protein
MVTKSEWHLNLPNKAEALVFKLVDERLDKTQQTSLTYDVHIIWSMTVGDNWRGFFGTSLDDFYYYDVTYNADAKAIRVEVMKAIDAFSFPDREDAMPQSRKPVYGPKRYRLIESLFEAVKLTPETVRDVVLWSGGVEVEEIDPIDSSKKFVGINIPTIDGVKRASQGDYVCKQEGDFFIVPGPLFETKFESI